MIKLIHALCLLALLLLALSAHNAYGIGPLLYGPYHATVLRVIDGDTIEADIRTFPSTVTRAGIRIYGVDTPEMRGKTECERRAAEAAKRFVAGVVPAGTILVLSNVMHDKYGGRYVARVTTLQGQHLDQLLIDAGHGVPYYGGRKQKFECGEPNGA